MEDVPTKNSSSSFRRKRSLSVIELDNGTTCHHQQNGQYRNPQRLSRLPLTGLPSQCNLPSDDVKVKKFDTGGNA